MIKDVNTIETIDTSKLVKKADYDKKFLKLKKKKKFDHNHKKYITTQKFNKITTDNFAAKLKQANLASKNNIGDFVKNIYILMKN